MIEITSVPEEYRALMESIVKQNEEHPEPENFPGEHDFVMNAIMNSMKIVEADKILSGLAPDDILTPTNKLFHIIIGILRKHDARLNGLEIERNRNKHD